ncbi:energy-coupling factor ABC transporter ATP-binding protein [Rhodobacter lacus]|uniref:Energy-coupling factor ABC transporter ATP-binding protein n=1 Tax=Rhodobacter lacus TaxID=1641972 RepID=A0ABW5A7I6_9RHOB
MSGTARIEISAVSHRFTDKPVLREITATLTERRIAIIGANGSGKSTFSRLLNGLLVPDRGRVTVDGLDTARDIKAVRRKVGFVFQNPDNQIVFPTVAEDLAFGLKGLGLGRAEREEKVGQMLARFGLEALAAQSAHKLSGGQKQMLAIAGVLITAPSCVVFDEPTTALDLRNARRIAEVISGLDETAIVVSHDLDLISDFDRVLVFDEGRIVADDTPGPAIAHYLRLMQ